MSPSCEANGRAWVDGCAGPRAHARWISGAGARVLPPAAPPRLINKSRPVYCVDLFLPPSSEAERSEEGNKGSLPAPLGVTLQLCPFQLLAAPLDRQTWPTLVKTWPRPNVRFTFMSAGASTDKLGSDVVADPPDHFISAINSWTVAGEEQRKFVRDAYSKGIDPHATFGNLRDEAIPRGSAVCRLHFHQTFDRIAR